MRDKRGGDGVVDWEVPMGGSWETVCQRQTLSTVRGSFYLWQNEPLTVLKACLWQNQPYTDDAHYNCAELHMVRQTTLFMDVCSLVGSNNQRSPVCS